MFDERFILHRYKSTSFAGIACALMVAAVWAWDFYRNGEFRLELFVIIILTALIKVGFMTWYRLRD
ncbi:hypothetical protein KDM41_06205 [bacterium]|nr:hypothetical protein [bacterium]